MLHDLLVSHWTKLGGVAPDALGDARLQAHHALQVVATVGNSLLKRAPDDSHISCQWLDRAQALVGEEVPGGLRTGLRLRDLRLLLMNKDGTELASLPLEGRNLEAGMSWFQDQWKEQAGAGRPKLTLPKWDMPDHAVGHEGKFQPEADTLGELSRWYANADRALQFVATHEREATRVRCWPHHFDMDTVLQLGKARTIGVGMSPGDASYRQPYFYVTPTPAPEGSLPALKGGGTWNRRGWTGAVLTASKLTAAKSAEGQVETLAGFLEHALAACRQVLAE